MMNNTITVGIADMAVAKAPDRLVTFALGSCVGICLYDPTSHIIGMSHILLPDSTQSANIAKDAAKFADVAPKLLIQKMLQIGANPNNIKAKIAGGAKMFETVHLPLGHIGERNVEAVKACLQALRIPILASDTGSNYGRTVYFDADTFTMHIKSAIKGEFTF